MIRPKQFVTETCHHCKRDGWRHEIPHHLLSEDEYNKVMGSSLPMGEIPGLPPDFEPMWAGSGASIFGAVKEAIEYCSDYNVTGAGFVFNDLPVIVSAESDPEKVAEDWWKKMFGETYQESAARR